MSTAEKYTKLGLAFLKGGDVPQDYEQAFYWFNAASEIGSDDADSALAMMYTLSLGVPYDAQKGASFQSEKECASVDAYASAQFSEAPSIGGLGNGLDVSERQTPNPNRCVVCGAVALEASGRFPGAKRCVAESGGCGSDSLLPIVENGLKRGIALQPYRQYLPDMETGDYTSFGFFVHTIKYDERADEQLKTDIIAEIANRIEACGILDRLLEGSATSRLVVIPAPSSVKRKLQPVRLLAKNIAEGKYDFAEPLRKTSHTESKNRARGAELAPGEIRCNANLNGASVLLVDDTYGEGATLRACIRALKECGASEIHFLSVCKNVYGGMKGASSDDDDIY